MKIDERLLESIIFKRYDNQFRFTQDSPVYPDIWMEYYRNAKNLKTHRVDLILSPHRAASAAELFKALAINLKLSGGEGKYWELASNGESVAARLTFVELLEYALPLTPWWKKHMQKEKKNKESEWMTMLVGAILYEGLGPRTHPMNTESKDWKIILKKFHDNKLSRIAPFSSLLKIKVDRDDAPLLWSVNRNRPATLTITQSVGTTKADACRKIFDIDGSDITWAILDSGIDARHDAFRKKGRDGKFFEEAMGPINDKSSNKTRVIASYDFTKFRKIIAGTSNKKALHSHPKNLLRHTANRNDEKLAKGEVDQFLQEIENDLRAGRVLDWTVIGPLLRIPHNNKQYKEPVHPHGTHVAGILAAGQYKDDGTPVLVGMCPGISVYDIRVLDENGNGDEFNVLAALQFIRWLNSQKDSQAIHGVNLSFSMIHAVASYACGVTPVCEACDRLVSEGIVVVAAAGNLGQSIYQGQDGTTSQGFRMVNITDPGNAESVITVGSTHRDRPHSYGVSYFSSKGPTGDGRVKPDLVAPGEKIVSSVINNATDRMDGTSMAAPHVSGAAALLLAKHRELIGRPGKVKAILCKTATDLGREKYFQGCGMLDVLRAIQSI